MAVTISNATGSFNITFDAATETGFIYEEGRFCLGGALSGRDYQRDQVAAVGVDGTFTVESGFRRRTLGPIRVIYTGTTPNNCNSEYEFDQTLFQEAGESLTLTYFGTTYPGCYLESFQQIRGPKNVEAGMYALWAMITLTQVRLESDY